MAKPRLPMVGTPFGFVSDREGPKSLSNGLRKAPSEESVHATIAKSNWICRQAEVTAPASVGSGALISLRMALRWIPENRIVLSLVLAEVAYEL